MDDPFEQHLRSLMQKDASEQPAGDDAKRLERVLHRAHERTGLFDERRDSSSTDLNS